MKKAKWFATVLVVASIILCAVGCANETVPPHEHTFATEWTSDAENHWKAAICEHTSEVSEKAEHTFGKWELVTEATEETAGSKERVCSVCKHKETVEIAQLAHTHKFATEWESDATNHWHKSTCGHEVVDGKDAHTFGDYVSNNDATTEADGTKTRECNVCGKKDTVADEGSKIHVHTFATEWTSDAENHWKAATCEHTSEVIDKAKHTFGDWTTTKEPTETESGQMQRVCEVCGETVTKGLQPAPEGFRFVEAGIFQMGSKRGYSDNKPVHEVTITKDFYMGKYEVTQAEYEKYCSYGSSSPSSSFGDGYNYPAYYVSWYDALVYCNKRSIAEGLTPCYSINDSTNPEDWGDVPTSSNSTWNLVECNWNANGYRLPTEAEWEYAARAGDNTVDSLTYSGTSDVNKLGDYAWYSSNSNDATHKVGTKLPNAFGLYDMSGNVWEWCWNWVTDSYDVETEGGSDPTGTSAGSYRVRRGGGWYVSSGDCAVSYRCSSNFPYLRSSYLGFRVVRASSID